MGTSRIIKVTLSCFVATSVVGFLLAAATPAGAAGRTLWRQISGRPSNGNAGYAVAANPNGSAVYVNGQVYSRPRFRAGMETIAYDPSGDVLWHSDFFGWGDAAGGDVLVSHDGQVVYAVGNVEVPHNGVNWVVIAYDAATGATRWQAEYGHRGRSEYPGRAVLSPDGSTLFVSGSAWQGRKLVPTVIAYDTSTGTVRWLAFDRSAHFGETLGIQATPDGAAVVIAAQYYTPADVTRTRVDAYDAATGGQIWQSTLSGGPDGSSPSGIAIAPDGSHAFVSATGYGPSGQSIIVAAYDLSTGTRAWTTRTRLGLGVYSTAVAVTPDGSRLVVSGAARLSKPRWRYLIASYDASSGALQWSHVEGDRSHQYDTAGLLTLAPDGSTAYISGISCATNQCNDDRSWLTAAYQVSNGAREWSARFAPAGTDDIASDMTLTSDGSELVVTGSSFVISTEANRFATVAYAA